MNQWFFSHGRGHEVFSCKDRYFILKSGWEDRGRIASFEDDLGSWWRNIDYRHGSNYFQRVETKS
jgi:hypothetical protein